MIKVGISGANGTMGRLTGGRMAQDIKIVSVSIPAALARELDTVCDREHRTRSELFREALRQYLKFRRWQALREYSTAKVAATGFDVESLIDELAT